MPDWFYRTAARPGLFALPEPVGRVVALGVIGQLGRTRAGRAVIDFLGHMRPDPRLAVHVGGVKFPARVGLGWRVDPERAAMEGLAMFGVGAIEVLADARGTVRRGNTESLIDGPVHRPGQRSEPGIDPPLLRRFDLGNAGERVELPSGVALPVMAWDDPIGDDTQRWASGVVLQVGTRLPSGGWSVPASPPPGLVDHVRRWRAALPREASLVVAGGVADPADAVALVAAGADLILVDAGLVFRGPGLIKRCNEALLPEEMPELEAPESGNVFRRAWIWSLALGVALALGGLATLVLAATRVLLPYDEHYLGLTWQALQRNSPRLFAFMAHDRGTLAGTMLGLGWLYALLAWGGIRRGVHGARTTVVASALTGFASFFAFFGFGYFDTLHAFVAAVLFQFSVQVMVGVEGGAPPPRRYSEREDARWRRALWGQLLWIVHATGLLIAGGVILGIGMTSVFVREDLAFLCLTEVQAQALGERMIGVVAHDRATLGGMLLASGIAMLLPVLWCFRRGASWLWTAMAGLGAPAYAAAIGVHLAVGYTDLRHLLPAAAGLLLWAGGLVLSRSYLRATE
jgi:dihydroorotate dehydrogenase